MGTKGREGRSTYSKDEKSGQHGPHQVRLVITGHSGARHASTARCTAAEGGVTADEQTQANLLAVR